MSPWHFGLSTGKFMAIGIFKSPGSRDPCSHSKRMCVSHHLQNILCNPLEERRGSVVKSPLIVLCPSDLYFVKWDPLINFFYSSYWSILATTIDASTLLPRFARSTSGTSELEALSARSHAAPGKDVGAQGVLFPWGSHRLCLS